MRAALTMKAVVTVDEELRQFRLSVAKREIPPTLLWTGGLFFAIAVSNAILGFSSLFDWLVDLSILAVMAIAFAVASNPRIPAAAAPWSFASAATGMVIGLGLQSWYAPAVTGYTYVAIALVAFPLLTIGWGPVLALGIPTVSGYVAFLMYQGLSEWVVVTLGAFALGMVLLRVRVDGIAQLAQSTSLARSRATTDQLTGLLNRHGVEERVDQLFGAAARRNEPVFIGFVDIDGLKAANDSHGHRFGDVVIRTVAQAARATMRVEDIVGRWGGDEFIVIGIGEPQPREQLEQRISATIAASDMKRGQWSGGITIGIAHGLADQVTFDDLLKQADDSMYAARRQRRS